MKTKRVQLEHLPDCMIDFIVDAESALVRVVVTSEETVFRNHAFLSPGRLVFLQYIFCNVSLINHIVVSERYNLFTVSSGKGHSRWNDNYWKLIADDEYHVRLTADPHPLFSFHFSHDRLLERHAGVAVGFTTHSPEDWVPVEQDTVLFIISVVVEKHCVK